MDVVDDAGLCEFLNALLEAERAGAMTLAFRAMPGLNAMMDLSARLCYTHRS